MINLLNNPKYDNERNVLNADLFVNNLRNTLKAFGFNPKVSYYVYRMMTVYHISWTDDKEYEDILKLNKEIALALGISKEELTLEREEDNKIMIKVPNMKRDILTLKELLSDFDSDNGNIIALGLDYEDKVITFDFNMDKNLLVTGVSGSGKTNLFRNIIMNLLINSGDSKIVILDSQGINYNDFDRVCEVINDEKDIIRRIKLLRKEFEERVKKNIQDRIIIFIDEIYEIMEMDNSIDEDINYLMELGSNFNMHLIVSTDTLASDDISRIFTNNNTSRLSFYLTTKGEYNMFLSSVVKEDLYKDGVYLSSDRNLSRILIPLINDDEIERVVSKIEEG